jgi:MFS family permease
LIDLTPLRASPGYRWLFSGLGLAFLARQLTVVAVPFQVYQITGSTLLVGMIGMAQFVPLLLASAVTGAIADAVDRRRLLAVSQVLTAATAAGLAWNASLSQPRLWPIYLFSGLNAAVSAVDNPTRSAALPALVGRSLLTRALALNQTLINVAKAVGPALAGLSIAALGVEATYWLEAGAFLVCGGLMSRVPRLRPEGGGTRFGLASILEGFRFLRSRRLLQANFLIDLNAMVFGMPQALFPAIGIQQLGGSAATVGLLYAAPGAGALLAALTSGWVGRVVRQGRAVIVAVVVWGLAIATFGLVSQVELALALLALAGGADVISAVFRNSILQLAVPDALRGRLSAIHTAVVAGGPRLGDLEAGVVASLTSVRFSVVSGGLACVLGAVAIARLVPEFADYRLEDR